MQTARPARAPRSLSAALGLLLFLPAAAAEAAPAPAAGPAPSAGPARDPAPTAARNVLFILTDTLSPFHLGCYGYDRDVSPVMDGLAARGALFESAWSTACWTKPAIPSLFTGRFPSEHAVFEGSSKDRSGAITSDVLAESWTTLAEALAAAGWRTGGFIENAQIRGFLGFAQGFDVYDDRGGTAEELFAKCRDWLESSGDRPFFAYVHLLDVHWPYRPPEPFDRLFSPPGGTFLDDPDVDWKAARKAINRGDQGLDEAALRRMRDLYDGEIAWMDRAIGRALDGLREGGFLENTLLVLVADHGEEFGEHGRIGHGQALRETLVRVPLLVVGPGIPPHRTKAPASLIDLYPTILDLLGLEAPADLPGRSLRPALEGRQADGEAAAGRPLFAERRDLKGGIHEAAVRQGSKKLLRRWKLRPEAEARALAAPASALPARGAAVKVKLAAVEESPPAGAPRVVESLEPLDGDNQAVKGSIESLDAAAPHMVVGGVEVALPEDVHLGSQEGPAPALEDLHPGQRVKVKGAFDPAAGRLAAKSVKLYRGTTGRDRLEGPVGAIDAQATPPRFRVLGRWLVLGPGVRAEGDAEDRSALVPLFLPPHLLSPADAFTVTDELFDLARDPAEREDLASRDPATREHLASILEAWLSTLRAPAAPAATEALDPEMLRELEGLGYLK